MTRAPIILRRRGAIATVEDDGFATDALDDLILSLSPVGYWPMHDPPGSAQATDVSGNGLHATTFENAAGVTFGEAGLLNPSRTCVLTNQARIYAPARSGLTSSGFTLFSIWRLGTHGMTSDWGQVNGLAGTTGARSNRWVDRDDLNFRLDTSGGANQTKQQADNNLMNGTTRISCYRPWAGNLRHVHSTKTGSTVTTSDSYSHGSGFTDVNTGAFVLGVYYGRVERVALLPWISDANMALLLSTARSIAA